MDTEVQYAGIRAPRLADVIGDNARRLRTEAGLTLDQVSIAARMLGLKWSEARVADFEAGRVAPNLATLIAVVLALQDVTHGKVSLDTLLRSATKIQLNDSLELLDEQVINLLSGHPARRPKPREQEEKRIPKSDAERKAHQAVIAERRAATRSEPLPPPDREAILAAVQNASGATEQRTRKALGIDATDLASLSAALWSRPFSHERDRRAGKGANAQKRGQISRQMRNELQSAIEAATHGDNQ